MGNNTEYERIHGLRMAEPATREAKDLLASLTPKLMKRPKKFKGNGNKKTNQEIIAELNNPQHPDAWRRAINNPLSPIYQLMMHSLLEEIAYEYRLERYLHILDERITRAEKLERAEFFAEMKAAEILAERRYEEAMDLQRIEEEKRLQKIREMSYVVIQDLVLTIPVMLSSFRTESAELKKQLSAMETSMYQDSETINLRKEKVTQKIIDALSHDLVIKQISDGKQLQNAANILRALPKPTPMHKVIQHNPALQREELTKVWTDIRQAALLLATKEAMNQEIIHCAALAGNTCDGRDLLKFLNLNKKFKTTLGSFLKEDISTNAADIATLVDKVADYKTQLEKIQVVDNKIETLTQMLNNALERAEKLEHDQVNSAKRASHE